jgi:hypothetical protein
MDRWARGETRGVYGSSSLVKKKKEKITLSFISPEKEKIYFYIYEDFTSPEKVKRPTSHYFSLSHTHTDTHTHTHTLSLSLSLSLTHSLSYLSLFAKIQVSFQKKRGIGYTAAHRAAWLCTADQQQNSRTLWAAADMVKKQAESVDFAAMSARTFAYCFRYSESWTRYLAIISLRVHTWARVPCTHARGR